MMATVQDILYRLATLDDLTTLKIVGDALFDHKIKQDRAIEFLNDPRHHLMLAFEGVHLIGIASGLHYVHPDKNPQLFVNEVSVLETHRNRGIARTLVKKLCEHGKVLGCEEAWVAAEKSNIAAQKAYLAAGGIEEKEAIVLFEFKQL